ncbi:MAG: hypothetical protein V4456_16350 [Bacteroidota bacterium]
MTYLNEKVNASALYIVVVMALVIAILCAAMISAAYFYRLQSQVKSRSDALRNNMKSGVNLLLANTDSTFAGGKTFSLFPAGEDSVFLRKKAWGVYHVGISKAFVQQDTVYEIFLIANRVDSAKWSSLYLQDEDRALSVSGNTSITGNAFLPKSGIRAAYVANKAYTGNKQFVSGHMYDSEAKLPVLDEKILLHVKELIAPDAVENIPDMGKTIQNSFLRPALKFDLKKEPVRLQNIHLSGNILLRSDTTIFIDSSAHLKNILIYAPAVIIGEGFSGSCQVFASDSISTGRNCHFSYPSVLGLVRFEGYAKKQQAIIRLGENTRMDGLIFAYEKDPGELKPFIALNKSVTLCGQVYSPGNLSLQDSVKVYGNLTTKRFLYQTDYSSYENYLINVQIGSTLLSPYYLSSPLMPTHAKTQKVLAWLESN